MSRKRILLVEDEPAVHEVLAVALTAAGYEVDVATTTAQAAAFLDSSPYSLVIADWRLPDGSGLQIANAAAETDAKTIVMSGYLFQMTGGKADRHEMLMKPLRPSEVLAAVERQIGIAGTR